MLNVFGVKHQSIENRTTSDVFVVNFQQILHIHLVFPSVALRK